jgi:hypothetical protein
MKKKIILGLIGAVLLGLSVPVTVQAQDYSFEVREERSYTVTVTYNWPYTTMDNKKGVRRNQTIPYTVRAFTASDAESKAKSLFRAQHPTWEFVSAVAN